MFMVGHCSQIIRPIVIFYPIQMMDYPPVWKRLVVGFFPYQMVFHYVYSPLATSLCSSVFRKLWAVYYNVSSRVFMFATRPIGGMCAKRLIRPLTWVGNQFIVAIHTTLRPSITRFSAVGARVFPALVIKFLFKAFFFRCGFGSDMKATAFPASEPPYITRLSAINASVLSPSIFSASGLYCYSHMDSIQWEWV